MVNTPYPMIGEDKESLIKQLVDNTRELWENRVGGASVGDVFTIGGDTLQLKIKSGSGLVKTNGELDIDVDIIGTNGTITKSMYTAKGIIIVGNGTSQIYALPVGADKASLIADSSATGGMKWAQLPAEDISNTPSGNIAATNMQDAINELDTEHYKAADGTDGVTADVTVVTGVNFGSSTVTTKTLHFKNGLYVGST